MATRKKTKGLGMGLEALLGPSADGDPFGENAALPVTLPLSQLQPGKYQPRTRMDEGALYELAESIKAQGVMQPLLVRPVGKGKNGETRYEIIAGERRSRAAKLAGLAEVPVLVKEVDDQAAAAMALIENMQREDLNPLEEAQGLQRLVTEFGLSHEAAAQSVGRSRSAASNLLRLLNLAQPVQTMLLAGDIDMGHARALLALDRGEQVTAANQIVGKKLSVREAERLVKHIANDGLVTAKRREPEKSGDVRHLEEELADLLTAPVEIRLKRRSRRGQSGELVIGFGSLDALDGILAKLRA